MIYFIDILDQISPFAMLPHIIMILFINGYLAYRKYQIKIELKNIPNCTVLQIDLSKVKRNLQIESMVYTFLLILSGLEFVSNLFAGIHIIGVDLGNFFVNRFDISETSYGNLTYSVITQFQIAAYNIFIISLSIFPPIGCLFLIVLRRAYLNLSYRNWIQGYTVCIVVRLIVLLLLSSVYEPVYQIQIFYFPLSLIDFFIYLSCCRSFYRVLRGRSEEARWHSTQSEYRIKRLIAIQFFYGQCFTITCFVLLLINFFTIFLQSLLVIILYYPHSLGIFQSVPLSHSTRSIILSIYNINALIQMVLMVSFVVLLALAYLLVSIGIIVKLVRKGRRYNHINSWITRPLMEQYRATFDESFRNREQRPPFIQNFMSKTTS